MHRSVLPRIAIVAALVTAWGCSGAAYSPVNGISSVDMVSSSALGPGDVVDVRVYQDKELSGTFQVSPEGAMDYPLLGTLNVKGKTPSQLADTIRKGLADGYLRNPYVTVNVKELQSKRIYVLGQVSKPGTFAFADGMTIIHVITLAGGFTKIARDNHVVVTRTVNGSEVRTVVPVDDIREGRAKNFYLIPEDIVFVPESIL